jgi:hypothetical protein
MVRLRTESTEFVIIIIIIIIAIKVDARDHSGRAV